MANNSNVARASELLREASELIGALGKSYKVHNVRYNFHCFMFTGRNNVANGNDPDVTSAPSITLSGGSTTLSGSGTTTSHNFGIAEVRSLFQPYQSPNFGNTTLVRTRTATSGRRSGARVTPERCWGQKVFCLGSPAVQRAPGPTDRLALTEAGLGQEIIQLRTSSPKSPQPYLIIYD